MKALSGLRWSPPWLVYGDPAFAEHNARLLRQRITDVADGGFVDFAGVGSGPLYVTPEQTLEEFDRDNPRPHTCWVCKVAFEHHELQGCGWYREERRAVAR